MNKKTVKNLIDLFYVILQVLLIAAFIVRKEYFSIVGTICVLAMYIIFLVYEHRKGQKINNFTRIVVLISVLANSFIGEYLRFYNTSVYFDKFLHAFGTFSFSIFTFSLIKRKDYFLCLSKPALFIFIVLLGTFIGTVFEVGEFLCDIIFKTVNQGNLTDTNVDMIGNIVGAALAGAFVVYLVNRTKRYGSSGS